MNKGIALSKILKLPVKAEIGRMKELREVDAVRNLMGEIDKKIAAVEVDR
jgi:V/A-type H+-transporting ATPase subunit A